ncbi:tyrosine-type recombinase/integrase [Endozoicomonas sp.]|uniref:tyrosine-type recombinase/integrase n=1 Tax=Endozoicomonas sp. TaxID=1892382 RepID=UPI003AF54D06
MAQLSAQGLISIKKKLSERVGGRGDGSLLFIKRESGTVEVYYRYKHQCKEVKIKIGHYRATRDGHGYTLAECRDKAQDLARLRRECHGDLKAHLDNRNKLQEQKRLEELQLQEIEARKGSFADLMESYVKDQEAQGKESAHQSRQAFRLNVLDAYPMISAKKAKDVTPDDIVTILAAIHQRGSEVESVRVRALLHACFNFGIKGDYDPTRITEKRFFIQHNPVTATKKNTKASKPGNRVLSHEEVRLLWHNIGNTHRVGFVLACAIRFMLATAGQRPKQLLRATWQDYDFQRNCVTLIDRKGRQGTEKIHVVPLTRRAMAILRAVREFSGSYPWPFCSGVKGRSGASKGELMPLTLESLKNGFIRYNKALAEQATSEDKPVPESFTARDIRRTVKNLMIDAGVNREQRNLLQSHAQNGVDVKHYDRHEHLPEKRESIRRYDALLDKILKGEETTLVDMDTYRQQKELSFS